jgi:hypothetical protein
MLFSNEIISVDLIAIYPERQLLTVHRLNLMQPKLTQYLIKNKQLNYNLLSNDISRKITKLSV